MSHGENQFYYDQHSSSTSGSDKLRLKQYYKTKRSQKHTLTTLPLVIRRTHSTSLFPAFHIDKSDCVAYPHSASLLSHLTTLHLSTEHLACDENDTHLNSQIIRSLRQDFYTLQNSFISQSFWNFGSIFSWCHKPHRSTCRTAIHFISERLSSLHVEKSLSAPGVFHNCRPDTWFWTRLTLADYFSRVHQLEMKNSTSLSDQLSCTNNNGLSSDSDANATPVIIKPRCQRSRSTRPSNAVPSFPKLDQICTRILIQEASSVTEDLDDLDDEASGSLNSDEPLKSDPITYFASPVHSLKPPASPRRALNGNTKSAKHRSRSSSRNGLGFDRVMESDSQTPVSMDDSTSTVNSTRAPKPRKRHQSITHLNCKNLMFGDEIKLANDVRRWKMNPSIDPNILKTSDEISSCKPEPVPRPTQRSRGSVTLGADLTTFEVVAPIVRGYRAAQQTLCPFEQSSRSSRIITHSPQQRTCLVIDRIAVWSLFDSWSHLTAYMEQHKGIGRVLYSPAWNVCHVCTYHSAQITFCIPPAVYMVESHFSHVSSLPKASAQSDWPWDDHQSGSMYWEAAPRSTDVVNRNADGDNAERQTSAAYRHSTFQTEDETNDQISTSLCRLEGEESNRLMNTDRLDGCAAATLSTDFGSGDRSSSYSTGPVGLDLTTQLRLARDNVQRKLDDLFNRRTMDEPELLAASCEQLRTFLGQLEAYNFRVGAVRVRMRSVNGAKSSNGTDIDVDVNELETIWSAVVQQAEVWLTTLQKAFVESQSLEQILAEFRRDLTFADARLRPLFQSTNQNEYHSSYWRLNSTNESNTADDAGGRLTDSEPIIMAQRLPSCQTPDETSQVPTALRLVRVIRFRLSGWYAHVSLLLLITDSTQVLSTLTRVQSGQLVSSRLTTDITTQTRLKQLRASVGRLVDEAERLLTAWSTHRSHCSIPLAVTHTSGNSVVTLVASDDMNLGARSQLSVFDVQCPEDQNASGPRLKQFRDQDSYLSSDTDENVEELVSVTSRSSVSLESDESDHLINYDKGVDISWASEMTAHSVAPSDNTSCGLTATLSQQSVQSVTTLGQQHQSEQHHINPHPNPDSNASHHSDGDPQLFIVPDLANVSPKVPVDSSHEDKTDPVMCNLYQNEMTHEEDRILKDTELLILPTQSTTPSDLRSFHSSNASGSDRSLISWYSIPVDYLLRLWRRILEWSIIRPFSRNPTLNKNLEFQSVTDSTSISSRVLLWSRFSHNWSMCGPLLRWSDRPWYRDLLIGTVVALLLIAIFPYFVHLLFSFPSSGDAQTTSCVYRWSRLFSWFQDTQEMGPGRTLAKTWPRHAPPF